MPSRKKAWVHGGRACGQQPGLYMSHSHCKGRIAGGAASSHSSTVCPIHPSLAFCNKANMRISENMGKKISDSFLMGQAQCSSVATEFHFQHHFLNKKFADSSLSICCIWFGKHYLTSLFSVTWLEGKKNKKIATSHQNIGAISSNSGEIVFKVSLTVTVLSDTKAGLWDS